MPYSIKVETVSKQYGNAKVLENVSFEVAQGEIFGLLGPNGAGKSTLLNIMCGLQQQDGGSVSFFGGSPNVDFKRSIALVPQEFAFYQDFSVLDNFLFFGASVGLKGAELRKRVGSLIAWLGLENFKGKNSGLLSGGYKRLLNIGLSLLWEPKVLFLDEVTVGLDPKMRAGIWGKIRQLKASGITVILTTHYMEEAQALCDNVCLLHKGAIAAAGSPNDLIEKFGGEKVIVIVLDKEISKDVEARIPKPAGVKDILVRGNSVILSASGKDVLALSDKVIDFFEKNAYCIVKSSIKEPGLEQVFINLTGSDLKE